MDNLTHSLVGALIGQAGLKKKTGLAMPALIIGANIPDIDATCTLYGIESLAMRRGLTHGPIALVILPLVLAALLFGWDRWQSKRGTRPNDRLTVSFGWLFALSFISCLTHPAMDWLNSYGIRLLEPFSHRWFYGDTLFIIDIWLWLGMGFSVGFSLHRERSGRNWKLPARAGISLSLAYIALNWVISHAVLFYDHKPAIYFENPVPAAFWKREAVFGEGDGHYSVNGQSVGDVPLEKCDLATARRDDRAIDAFLFWTRVPFIERKGQNFVLRDARFTAPLTAGRFEVPLPDGTCQP